MNFEDIPITIYSEDEDVAVRQALQEMGYRWADDSELTKISYWKFHKDKGGYYLHTYLDGTVCKGNLWFLSYENSAISAQEFLCPIEEEPITGLTTLLD